MLHAQDRRASGRSVVTNTVLHDCLEMIYRDYYRFGSFKLMDTCADENHHIMAQHYIDMFVLRFLMLSRHAIYLFVFLSFSLLLSLHFRLRQPSSKEHGVVLHQTAATLVRLQVDARRRHLDGQRWSLLLW